MGDRRGNVGAATLVVVGAVLLAACSGSSEGAAPFPTTTSATATPTPSSKPTTPKQEVEEAVRAYYAAMDVAIRTGNTRGFGEITTERCRCREFAAGVGAIFKDGKTMDAGVEIIAIHRTEVHGQTASVDVSTRTRPYTVVSRTAANKYPGGEDRALVGFLRSSSSPWRVASVVFLDRKDDR